MLVVEHRFCRKGSVNYLQVRERNELLFHICTPLVVSIEEASVKSINVKRDVCQKLVNLMVIID